MANKQPVGVPALPIDEKQYDLANTFGSSVVDASRRDEAVTTGVFGQTLVPEPARRREGVSALDSVVQAVAPDQIDRRRLLIGDAGLREFVAAAPGPGLTAGGPPPVEATTLAATFRWCARSVVSRRTPLTWARNGGLTTFLFLLALIFR